MLNLIFARIASDYLLEIFALALWQTAHSQLHNPKQDFFEVLLKIKIQIVNPDRLVLRKNILLNDEKNYQ